MGSEETIMDRGIPMSSDGVGPFYGSNWDPIISLNQSGNFGNPSIIPQNEFSNPHYSDVLQNQILERSSHLACFPSGSDLVDMVPKIPSFGNESLSEMVNTFGHISDIALHSNTAQNNSIRIQKALRNGVESLENCHNSDGLLGTSPNGKRKRKISTGASSFKDAEGQQKDSCEETSEFPQYDDEKIQNFDQNFSAKSRGKLGVNQVKDSGAGSEPCKENYIHVRAKRGQATNSHSLAERVRRERISERMKLLQELVPGCNKITGKAVMLDEIINYVQSLQQQVEFLSMKLATVNPELNVDIEQILSKNILNSRGSNATVLGFCTGLDPSHTFPGFSNGNFYANTSTTQSFHRLPRNSWNNELQSILQMGFECNPSGQDGLSNMDL